MLVFSDTYAEKEGDGDNPNTPSSEKVISTYETVYLFQWLVPKEFLQRQKIVKEEEFKKVIYPKFSETFLNKGSEESKQGSDQYMARFIQCEAPDKTELDVPSLVLPGEMTKVPSDPPIKPLDLDLTKAVKPPAESPYEEDFEEENNQDPNSVES